MLECYWDECGQEYLIDDSDARFPNYYCSSKCQNAADAEDMGVSI